MSKLMSTLTLAAVSTLAFTSSAFAGDTGKTNMTPASLKTSITVVEEVKSSDNAMMIEASTEVRGAVERGDYMTVEGPDGRIYYNRIIPVSELPDPELQLRVLDTVQVNHDGTVYTNRIVQPLN